MSKKLRLTRSREHEARKIEMAIKMMARGESSPHGRRKDPRVVLHREVQVPFIPMVPMVETEPVQHKLRHGRHHAPPSRGMGRV